ncbi:hypothetical protein ACFQ1S_39960, partial [Kibdelosporangium lantanae]
MLNLRPSIQDQAQSQFPIQVLPGATSLNVRIGNPAVVNSDLDLYLFDCTTGSCVQRAVSGSATADEQVSV